MKIMFFEHTGSRKVGGMELAAKELGDSLRPFDIEVLRVEDISEARKYSPDIIHFHGIWNISAIEVDRYFKENKIPTVISPHGMLDERSFHQKWLKKIIYFNLVERKRLLQCSGILAASEQEKKNIDSRVGKNRSTVIPLGISAQTPYFDHHEAKIEIGVREDEIILLFLGRIHPIKGLKELLSAIHQIDDNKRRNHRLHLMIVGDGDKKYIENIKKNAGPSDEKMQITWVGPVWNNRKWKYFAAADLFCFPSLTENFGYSALEAGYMGAPILASVNTPWASTTCPDLGLPVEPNPVSIRQGIERFLDNYPYWQSTRNARHEWILRNYSWDNLAGIYLKYYENILQG